MATVTKGRTFVSGEVVTPTKLNNLVDLATVTGIVNADIDAAAAIADSKLATISTAGKVANSATTATSGNPILSVVSITRTGTTATVTTATAHGLTSSSLVNLQGANQSEYNGQFAVVSSPTTTTFNITVAGTPVTPATGTMVAVNAETSPLSVSSIVRVGSVATVTTANPHGLGPTDVINIRGANQPEYNGGFSVVSVPTSSTITIAVTGTPATPATGTIILSPPTIVERDSSGNFSAGRITANLTGNVTGNVTGNSSGLSSPASNGLAKAFVAFTAPPALASTSINGSTATMTATKLNHNLNTGDQVTIFNQTGNNVVLNGTWLVTRTDANNFTFVVTTAPASAISGLSIAVYPVKIFSSWNISRVAPAATNSVGSYDVTFSNGLTFPTYTTFTGSTATTSPSYWVTGSAEQEDSSGAWPQGLRVSTDLKTSTGFRVRATYSAGTGSVTSVDWDAVFLSVYSL